MEEVKTCVTTLEELQAKPLGLINDNENKSGCLRQLFHKEYDPKYTVFTPGAPTTY